MIATREIAEQIARDASCAQGECHQRALAILPYLTPAADEIERLRAALTEIANKRTPQGMPPDIFADKVLNQQLATQRD